jgi:NADPH:quinone reductase
MQGIDDKLRLRHGETLLVYGASGAVGTLAVQFAKRRGARVIGAATGRQAMGPVRKLGADEVFDARSPKASEHLGELASKGIDAALVLASGESLGDCLALVRKGGCIASPHGVEPEPKRRRGVRVSAYDAVAGPREFDHLEAPRPKSGFACQLPASFRWRSRRVRTHAWNAGMSWDESCFKFVGRTNK